MREEQGGVEGGPALVGSGSDPAPAPTALATAAAPPVGPGPGLPRGPGRYRHSSLIPPILSGSSPLDPAGRRTQGREVKVWADLSPDLFHRTTAATEGHTSDREHRPSGLRRGSAGICSCRLCDSGVPRRGGLVVGCPGGSGWTSRRPRFQKG